MLCKYLTIDSLEDATDDSERLDFLHFLRAMLRVRWPRGSLDAVASILTHISHVVGNGREWKRLVEVLVSEFSSKGHNKKSTLQR